MCGINGLGVSDVLQLAVPSDHDQGRSPEEIMYMNTLLEDAYTEDKRTLAPYSFAHPALGRFLPVDRDGSAANGGTIAVLSPAGEKTAKGRKLAETRLEQRDRQVPRIAYGPTSDPRGFEPGFSRMPDEWFDAINKIKRESKSPAVKRPTDSTAPP